MAGLVASAAGATVRAIVRVASVLACCLIASAVLPASATAATERAQAGDVAATLSYDRSGRRIANTRIVVARAGSELLSERGPRFGRCREGCEFSPINVFVGEPSIFVRNLDPDAEPEVLAEFYSGGANCCAVSRVYDFDPAGGRYARIERNWNTGNHRGARDLDGDGVAEIVSSDARFDYRFGCGACTPEPIRILQLRDGRLRSATRGFRTAVRADLNDHRRTYRRARLDRRLARGALAAVIADRYLLGESRIARRTLRLALARGRLRGYRGDGVPDGRAYVRSLLRFLDRAGYR